MFKTRIVRAICKLLFIIATRGFIAKVSDYKSKDYEKFHDAYKGVFNFIWRQMEEYGIMNNPPSDRNFVDFISLHFPM